MIPAISLIFLLPTALAAFVTHSPSLCFSPLFSAKMTKIPQLIHQSVVARRKLLTAAASSTSLIPLRMKSSSSCSTLSANDSVNKLHTRNYSTSFSLLSVLSTNAQQKRQGQVLQLASSSQQGGNESESDMWKSNKKMTVQEKLRQISDVASIICVLDCTILPIVTVLLPLLGTATSATTSAMLHELGHGISLYFVLPSKWSSFLCCCLYYMRFLLGVRQLDDFYMQLCYSSPSPPFIKNDLQLAV